MNDSAKCCENCGNLYCQYMMVAVLYDECLESGYEKHWMPREAMADG